MPPLIALEEHYFADIPDLPASVTSLYSEQFKFVPGVETKLKSLSDLRLSEMRKAGVTFQIVSHAPGLCASTPEICAAANDFLAARIADRRDVFAGFAVLPMAHPAAAADELRRCVRDLGFVGALVDNHVPVPLAEVAGAGTDPAQQSSGLGVTYYDSPAFHTVWAAAQELDVPIYLHPTFPSATMRSHYQGSYAPAAGASLATSGWGWHSECGTHVLRLFAAGVFDLYPTLKIVVGHFGEMLPFMSGRVRQLSNRWGVRQRDWAEVYKSNIFVTTSGVWGVEPMATVKAAMPRANVLFSIDWPFAHAEWGREFWEELAESGMYTEDELQEIGWRNAAKLFKLDEDMLVEEAEKWEKGEYGD